MCAAVHRQRHLVRATKVNAGLAESNGRLLLGIWSDSLHVTCGLTACTPGSAPGPTLGNEYGKTLPFTFTPVQLPVSGCMCALLVRHSRSDIADVRRDVIMKRKALWSGFFSFFITETGHNPVAAVFSEPFTTSRLQRMKQKKTLKVRSQHVNRNGVRELEF